MLLFEKNFMRRTPNTRERSVFSSPVYRFSGASRGMAAVSVYHVRAVTLPIPASTRAPTVSVSSTPETSSWSSVTAVPGCTAATPSSARTFSTSPARRAMRLEGVCRSSRSGAGIRSRTWTWARQPETLTVIQLSSGMSSSTWLRMLSPSRDRPKEPR